MKKLLIHCSLIFFTLSIHAQHSLHFVNENFHYREGLELLTNKKYGAARLAFTQYLEAGKDPVKRADARYYIAYCSIQLDNADAEALVEQFIRANPHHPKSAIAYFELGNLKYENKDYREAIRYYEKMHFPALDGKQTAEARFRLGYAHFTLQQFDEAYAQFNELKHYDNQYQYASSYYAGYINFQNGEYNRALYDFKRAGENDYYARIVPELIMKVYYKQGRTNELVEYGETMLADDAVKKSSDFYLYLAEGYYQQKDYEKAATYFDTYDNATRSKAEAPVLLRMADARQKTGQPEKAIDDLKSLAVLEDTTGQLAAYNLGELYVETNQLAYAASAFRTAFEKSYLNDLSKDALFQYAKVNYEQGNYKEAISSFEMYSKQFGATDHQEEINEMLTDAYFKTNNYDAAIDYFDRMNFKTDKVKRAYQKITFQQGAALFNAERYYDAIELFDKSEEYPIDESTFLKTLFWKAETFYLMGQYDDAKNAYSRVFQIDPRGESQEYLKSRYGIGYVYFNEKQYDKALDHFKYYVGQLALSDRTLNYNDAVLRLADCYYTTKQYQAALQTYDRAIEANPAISDYAYFRKGVIHGLNNELQAANRNFDMVINNYSRSTFIDDAVFQKATFNLQSGAYDTAIKWFSTLIDNYPQSKFVPYGLKSRALAYANQGNHQGSADDYKNIINNYAQHPAAEDALLGLQQELVAMGRSDEFSRFVNAYKNANPGKSNLENIEFESAKTLYFEQKYNRATEAFEAFIRNYPNSGMQTEAKFYAADADFRSGNLLDALDRFNAIADKKLFSKHTRVIERMGEIHMQMGDYEESVKYYRQLEDIAANNKERYRAWEALMEGYYKLNVYDSVDHYANAILDKGLIAASSENKALLYLGKSAYDRGYLEAAIDYFLTTLNTAKDQYGAEAQYHIGLIHYQQNKYQKSLETLFDLNNNFGVYQDWIGKSFLLIAENYIAMEEDFQAKATLESIIANANDPELKKKANQKLNYLKTREKVVKEQAPDTLEIENPE